MSIGIFTAKHAASNWTLVFFTKHFALSNLKILPLKQCYKQFVQKGGTEAIIIRNSIFIE